MSPVSETYTKEQEQNEEIIRWYADMSEDAFENEDIHGPDGYLKPCSDDGCSSWVLRVDYHRTLSSGCWTARQENESET